MDASTGIWFVLFVNAIFGYVGGLPIGSKKYGADNSEIKPIDLNDKYEVVKSAKTYDKLQLPITTKQKISISETSTQTSAVTETHSTSTSDKLTDNSDEKCRDGESPGHCFWRGFMKVFKLGCIAGGSILLCALFLMCMTFLYRKCTTCTIKITSTGHEYKKFIT